MSFTRDGRNYVHCAECRAIFQPNLATVGADLHADGSFVANIESDLGERPDFDKLDEFRECFRPGRLLEVGPGTGHFLAACREAGFTVAGAELSASHRRYMREKWGIEAHGHPIEDNLLPAASFDDIVSFNCIEHVPDSNGHFAAAARLLVPGGRLFVSTCNADALLFRIVGRYWSMLNDSDHYSIPSPESLVRVGQRVGLRLLRLWSGEYPLETPVGIAVAARDWLRGQRSATVLATEGAAPGAREMRGDVGRLRRAVRRAMRAESFRWVADALASQLAAGAVRALYEK